MSMLSSAFKKISGQRLSDVIPLGNLLGGKPKPAPLSPTILIVGGAVAVGAFLLLRRK